MDSAGELQAQVEEKLTGAAADHPWLRDLLAGREPDVSPADLWPVIGGIVSLQGAIIESLALIAETIDRQNASR